MVVKETASLIAGVVNQLERLGRPVVKRLRPGLASMHIEMQLAAINLKAPTQLLRAYVANDGTSVNQGDSLDSMHFFPGFYWLAFDDAIACYQAIAKSEQWSAHWFPVFANGGGDFYAVCCDDQRDDFGCVVGFILGEPEVMVEFFDLDVMFLWMNRCFEEGIFFEEGDSLEADFARSEQEAELFRQRVEH